MNIIHGIAIEESLRAIVKNHPTDWPLYFAQIAGDQRLSFETRMKLAEAMDIVTEEMRQKISC